MSIIPIANQPMTPTEMIVSSVMRESEELGVGFELESAGFITDGKFPRYQIDGHQSLSKVHAFCVWIMEAGLMSSRGRFFLSII